VILAGPRCRRIERHAQSGRHGARVEKPVNGGPETGLPKSTKGNYSGAMILIAGTIRIPADKIHDARDAMARMIVATRVEDGCVKYDFAEDVLDPGLIHISELWRDQAALEKHAASAHMSEWRKAGREFGVGERNLRIYEVDEGRPL